MCANVYLCGLEMHCHISCVRPSYKLTCEVTVKNAELSTHFFFFEFLPFFSSRRAVYVQIAKKKKNCDMSSRC